MEKIFCVMSTSQCAEIYHDPTAYIEAKVERELRKKRIVESFVCFKIYPNESSSRKFCGTAKLHKVPNNGSFEQLPIRPIISNIKTGTYDLAKYLSQVNRNILSRMVRHSQKGSRK